MKRQCKHEDGNVTKRYLLECEYVLQFNACIHCGCWLPMGPSNDDPADVQCEIRAAEIAAGDIKNLGRCEPCGWDLFTESALHAPNPQHNQAEFHTGWLARAIHTSREERE